MVVSSRCALAAVLLTVFVTTVSADLVEAVRKGDGFLVQLGTPIYVLHLEDSKSKPLAAVQALLDHLDGKRPEEGSQAR